MKGDFQEKVYMSDGKKSGFLHTKIMVFLVHLGGPLGLAMLH